MDGNGHDGDSPAPHRNRASAGTPLGAEVLDFPGLLARARGNGIDPYSPRRPTFHELLTVRAGSLRCAVDFTEYELTEGGWLWVRPGQVHQYRSDLAGAEGTAVLFRSGFLSAATVDASRADRRAWHLPPVPEGSDGDAIRRVLDLLESEYRRPAELPLEVRAEVVRHLLAVLVLRLAHLRGGEGGEAGAGRDGGPERDEPGSEVFRRFQQALERGFARTHRVEDYARELGYSVRTLTRAARAAQGCGAKRFIDDRVLLEARRLLVHTDLSATAIAERLGFPGPAVFTKFFRQRAGETPATFRDRARGGPPDGRSPR
ncbi:helix-turn-helix transcriptional regulator [Streptomyces sp. SP18CS02]|uniref:helix-turn-helix transcriptional regulator n=1 Tax=Streptomyces sp. SP18CS02 TaxID=3002531 RepID=UPI002E783BD2|nr:AraC family transcriptional regulator [Streptomyces sp. SP18CS02]MEE1754769.1 AraC family transcriptional regulator [Streptomyces sp. SP18CS02]